MEENKVFDASELAEAMVEQLSVELADALECAVNDNLENIIHNALPEALQECFGNFEFTLKDGTVVRPRQHMMLLSPDKTQYISCYGGLRIHNATLMVQTQICSWDAIQFGSKEEAVEALLKVKNAMDANLPAFEL